MCVCTCVLTAGTAVARRKGFFLITKCRYLSPSHCLGFLLLLRLVPCIFGHGAARKGSNINIFSYKYFVEIFWLFADLECRCFQRQSQPGRAAASQTATKTYGAVSDVLSETLRLSSVELLPESATSSSHAVGC